jgi:FHS family L-fucose permease-like MFS transporter
VATQTTSATSSKVDLTKKKPGLVYPGMGLLFIVVVGCFTAWGIAADLTTPMVAGFKRIFEMSTFEASLVQLAYYGAYFLLALPAAFINQRFGYKMGLCLGLGLAAVGSFAFWPAAQIMTYGAFLTALFLIAAGCSILETSANPYVLSIGPEETATRRLNFAQAFNPVGTNIGVLLATALILPKLDAPVDVASATPEQVYAIRAGQLGAVMGPYIGLGMLLLFILVVIATRKAPEIVEEFPDTGEKPQGNIASILWKNKRYRFGVVAQFFNVAAQVCTWTYIIQYVQQAVNGSLALGGVVLQISLILFLVSRFVMTWIIGRVRPTKVLFVMGALAVLFCLSLMFPTIYGVALKGLGPATKFGAAGLVMAIVGGAVMPLVQGRLLDATSPAISFLVPAIGFAVVTLFAVYDLRAKDPTAATATKGAKA